MTSDNGEREYKQSPLTGGIGAAIDKTRGIGSADCGHDDWGYYPPLQEIYILWCRTCGTIKQCIPSADQMEIVGARYLNPTDHALAGLAQRLAAALRELIAYHYDETDVWNEVDLTAEGLTAAGGRDGD